MDDPIKELEKRVTALEERVQELRRGRVFDFVIVFVAVFFGSIIHELCADILQSVFK